MIEKQTNFILSIDLLGFADWISTTPVADVLDEYASIITGVSHTAEIVASDKLAYCVYSDTLVIISHGTTGGESLINLLRCAHTIQYTQLYRGMVDYRALRLLRGTIAYGDFIYHKGDLSTQAFNRRPITAKNVELLIGPPVVEAYKTEKQLQLMAIILARSAVAQMSSQLRDDMLKCGLLVEYKIPMKNEPANDGYVCCPLSDCHVDAILDKLNDESTKHQEDSNIAEKYENTIRLFRHLKENGLFHPRIPS